MDAETLATEVRACMTHYRVQHDRPPSTRELWQWLSDHSPIAQAAKPEGTLPFD